MVSLNDWVHFLRVSHSAAGFPLVIGGLGLMLFGWRMWKVCVVLAFGLIGTGVTAWLVGPSDDQVLYSVAGGAALGLLSYWPANYSISALGGLVGGAIVVYALRNMGLEGTPLSIGGGIAFIACSATAHLNRQNVVIAVTAFIGAMLLISGLAAWIMASPGFFGTLQGMVSGSAIVLPFLLLVPTVMSSFYQGAEVRRLNANV